MQIFLDNFMKITEHNQKYADDATWGVNHMMDWTSDEYKRLLGFKGDLKRKQGEIATSNSDIPLSDAAIDWRDKGAVT